MDRTPYREHVAKLRERGCTILGGDDLFAPWSQVVNVVRERLSPEVRPVSLAPLLLDELDT